MSGIFTTLSRASSALAAQQYGLDVTGQNMANINTAGYTRRVVQQGQQLATAFNSLAARLAQARTAADTKVRSTVSDINTLAAQVASLNDAMSSSSADQATLQDQQNVALSSLAKLANITVMPHSGGIGVDVTIGNGRPLVVGAKAYALAVSAAPVTGLAAISSNGVDVTGELTNGTIGGLLQVRDTTVPGYQSQLDALAASVANAVNARHAAGYTLGGATGQTFFVDPPAGNVGAAAALAVDLTVVNDSTLVAASGNGAAGDNQTAKDIAALSTTPVSGNATLIDSWGQLVYTVANDVKTATTNQQIHGDVVTALQKIQDGISSVSLDEEAANMLKFQRAYEANARFFSTVNGVLDNLLNMVS